MKERLQLLIGKALLIGLLLSLLLTLFGGIFYLVSHGTQIGYYEAFKQEPRHTTSAKIWHDITSFSAYGTIQLGILVLVLSQLLRVLLVAWYFFRLHDLKFCLFSLLILCVLIYSLFWDM